MMEEVIPKHCSLLFLNAIFDPVDTVSSRVYT